MSDRSEEIRATLSRSVSAAFEKRALGYGVSQAMERALLLGGYDREQLESAPFDAVAMWSGCGDPLSRCVLQPGESVLELGCGGGLDLVLAALQVGRDGQVVGIDMNEDACQRALKNVQAAGFDDTKVEQGLAEVLPFSEASMDVIFSNGVLSLSPDMADVISSAARTLAPGGRLVATEVSLVSELPDWLENNGELRAAGIVGASSIEVYTDIMSAAGLDQIEVLSRTMLSSQQLEELIDRGMAGLEIAGCSASGAIMGSEVAAFLTDTVVVATIKALKRAG